MDAMAGGEADGPPGESRRPEGEPPLVVALPAEEALALLRQAGWNEVEVRSTRAPSRRRRGEASAGAWTGEAAGGGDPRDLGEGGEWFVVRQGRAEGVIRLTVAAHPGGPWRPGEGGSGA